MRFLKALGLALVGAALTATGALAQGKDWSKIRIATEGAYAPWNFMEGGKLVGFEVDLANEFCRRMKATCEIVAQDWDGIVPALNAGKYDAIMAGMNITAKRQEVLNFSQPYAATPHGFGVLKSSPLAKLPGTGEVISLTTNEADAVKAVEAMKPLLKGKVVGAQSPPSTPPSSRSISRTSWSCASTKPPSSTTSTSSPAASM